MFRNFTRTGIAAVALTAVVMLPASAHAQRGGGHGRGGGGNGGRTVIVTRPARPIVIAPYGYSRFWQPYYNPYFFWGTCGWGFPGFFGPTIGYGPYGPYGVVAESEARIQVVPKQAEVYVDGALAGTVDDFDGFLQRLRLPPGEHTIDLCLDGFRPVSQTLHFVPGKTVNLKFAMQPLAPGDPMPQRPLPRSTTPASPPPAYDAFGQPTVSPVPAPGSPRPAANAAGMLAIRVLPGEAVIVVDGERWHTSGTDRLDLQVAAGDHRVEVLKEGYQPFSTTVTVRPGETSAVNVSLSKGGE